MVRLVTVLVITLITLLGCDQEAMMERLTPKEEAAHAKEVIGRLATRDFKSVEASLAPSLRSDQLRGRLEEIARMLPTGQPKSVRMVGAHTMKTPSSTTYDLSFEYEYPNAWFVANAVLERRDGKLVVQGLHFTPNRQSLE